MKRKLLVCALVACAMTLCLALTGYGGGGATNDKDAKEAFIGSWKLAGMVSDGEEATAEDIAMLDAFGMSVGLNVNEDGTCALVMFGEPLDGTWQAKSATEAKFTIDGSPITATIADGKLQMTAARSRPTVTPAMRRPQPPTRAPLPLTRCSSTTRTAPSPC